MRLDACTDFVLRFLADDLGMSRQDLVRSIIAELIEDLMPEVAGKPMDQVRDDVQAVLAARTAR